MDKITHPTKTLHRYLRTHDCFQHLTPAQTTYLLEQARVTFYHANETVFLEGETAVGLWWLESGSVKIYKLHPSGGEQILHLAGPGETFNDIAVYDNGPNPANVETLSAAKIWLLPMDPLQKLLTENPTFARAVIHALAQRVRYFASKIEDLTLYDVTARLARFLLQQAETAELTSVGVTRKAMAGYLATTPETVSRTLRTLQEAGAIQFDRHHILIVNPHVLKTIAHT